MDNITFLTLLAVIIAYLLGSISTSIVLCKLAHLEDPRNQGSGNPGATNMLRVAGKKFAFFTLLGDIGKGIIAVIIGRLLGQHGFNLSIVALAVFVGHLYPVFFGFKGGKGVATAFGAMLGLSPILGGAVIITWLIIALIFRYSSLAALVAGTLAPIYTLFLASPTYFVGLVLITLFLYWRHRANIERLRTKTESKIGQD